jgi:TolB-like protein
MLSSDRDVPRQRLVDLLWSTRNIEQGRASLRQSLFEIRMSLAPAHENLIGIERDRIWLDRQRVWVDGISQRADIDSIPAGLEPGRFADRLLETLTGLDPRFDEWIISTRRAVEAYLDANHRSPPATDSTESTHGGLVAGKRRQAVLPEQMARGLVISVVPFVQMSASGPDNSSHFALTQEILTTLARCRWLQVRLSTPDARGDTQYRLEGYISHTSGSCHIAVRLIDQTNRDVIVWRTNIRAPSPLQYETIAEVTEKVVEQLDPEILAIETRKAVRRPSASPDAYQCVLSAIPLIYSFKFDAWRQATQLLRQATEIDPQDGRALAFSALCRLTGLAQGWSTSPQDDLHLVGREAERGAACDPHDSLALALYAHVQSFLRHDFDGALNLYERAIRSNPSCGFSWGYSSLTFAYLGRTDEASRRIARAQAIMIHDPFSSFIDAFNTVIYFFKQDWATTISLSRHHLERQPSLHNLRKLLIGALCFQGKFADAQREARLLSEFEPQFDWVTYLQTYPFGRPNDRSELKAALMRARLIVEREVSRADQAATSGELRTMKEHLR